MGGGNQLGLAAFSPHLRMCADVMMAAIFAPRKFGGRAWGNSSEILAFLVIYIVLMKIRYKEGM